MLGQAVSRIRLRLGGADWGREVRRLRALLARGGVAAVARLLGTADGRAVATMARRELALVLRSREWHRCTGMWCVLCAVVLTVPLLYRSELGHWRVPSDAAWFALCGYALQIGLAVTMFQWAMRRMRRDLSTNRLDELMLTRCSPADIAMGEALASAVASLWLAAAAVPVCLFLSAMAGKSPLEAVRLAASIAPAGALGVWLGMGWGLAFTLRRPAAAFRAITDWWLRAPFLPFWAAWCVLTALPVLWALVGLFFPDSLPLLYRGLGWVRWALQQIWWHWNPLLPVAALAGTVESRWLTDWLVLLAGVLFMMRKSMDSVQLALQVLPEPERPRYQAEHWIHHDVHYFMEFGSAARRQPNYAPGVNPIAAYDMALGHRVYLHPFLWCLGILAYLFLLGWCMLVPELGRYPGAAAVFIPATGALLLMSGGVAISFGYERDQHRWPALAVLPIDDLGLALGKIAGVVRPTLWLGLAAAGTAALLGLRGALPMDTALWMALHVLVFPVTLACVSAVLALTTPTLGEAVYRWAVLGALPALATLLPPPIGGAGGIALPFNPPLLVLLLVILGPTEALIRGAWISLGLEVVGIAGSLFILKRCLRRWTVGEKE